MTILPMTAAHVPQIAALERRCFSDPWSETSVASELENPLSLWLVALEDETVLGYIGSQTVFDESDVMNLAVSPDRRREGLGAALLQALESRLLAQGVRVLALEVRASNAPALALYQSRGFSQAGLRKNYYTRPKEDALILKKQLVSL